MTDLEKAKNALFENNCTLVLCKEGKNIVSNLRGVRPLLYFIDNKISLKYFSAADKVVGKAAAYLYVLLGVKNVYASVLSVPAGQIFEKYNITVQCEKLVPFIKNRSGRGRCPMETAVLEINDAESALCSIKNKLKELEK